MCSVLPVHSSPMLSCDRSACFASSCSQGGQGGLTHVVTQRYLPHFFRSYFSAKSLELPPGFRATADRQDHVEHTGTSTSTGTVTPVSSQRRCTAATQLLGGLSCLICSVVKCWQLCRKTCKNSVEKKYSTKKLPVRCVLQPGARGFLQNVVISCSL